MTAAARSSSSGSTGRRLGARRRAATRSRACPAGALAAVGHDDDVADSRPASKLLEQRQQRRVHDHDAVLGVRGDVPQLVGMEPQVERVQHRAQQRHGEVGLEVAVVVPAERGDPVARADAERAERAGEPVRAAQALA